MKKQEKYMIKSSRNSQEPRMQKQQKNLRKHFRQVSKIVILTVVSLGAFACGGPNKHKDLWPDPRVLQREWTRETHGQWEAGERGAEFSNPVFYENTLIFGSQGVGVISLY